MKSNMKKVVLALLIAVLNSAAVRAAPETASPKMYADDFVKLCEEGKAQEVEKALRENRADVDAIGYSDMTGLMTGIVKRRPDVVDVLLKFHPEVDKQNARGYTALMFAAENGQTEMAETLLNAGANGELYDTYGGKTAFFMACENTDDPKLVRLLMAHGADVERKDKDGLTPLMAAVMNGHCEVEKVLIEAGVNIEESNSFGMTALLYAINGGVEAARILLDVGAKLEAKNENFNLGFHCTDEGGNAVPEIMIRKGNTVLHCAAAAGNAALAELLIKAGADVHARNGEGDTPIMLAAEGGHKNVIDVFLKVEDELRASGAAETVAEERATDDHMGMTPFMFAATAPESAEALDALLEYGVNLSARDENDHDVLWFLSKNWHMPEDEKKRLADKISAMIETKIDKFFALCEAGKTEEVEKALTGQRYFTVDAQDDKDRTPLMVAIAARYPSVADVLLKFNPELDIQDKEGATALIYAARNDLPEVAEKLLKANADVSLRDADGMTALVAACFYTDDTELVQLFILYGADTEQDASNHDLKFAQRAHGAHANYTPLIAAIEQGHLSVMRTLIDAGVNIEKTGGEDSYSPLYYAALRGDDAMRVLLDAGADVNGRAGFGSKGALRGAVEKGSAEAVERLVKAGARYNDPDIYGITPFMAAAEMGHKNVVDFFLNSGMIQDKVSLVNATSDVGWTAAMFAAHSNHSADVLGVLLDFGADVNVRDNQSHNVLWHLMQNRDMPVAEKKLCADKINALMRKQR